MYKTNTTRSYFVSLFFFFFNDTATTEIYTLSLHDALPICVCAEVRHVPFERCAHFHIHRSEEHTSELQSHSFISYAVFCLKKKTKAPSGRSASTPYHECGCRGREPGA